MAVPIQKFINTTSASEIRGQVQREPHGDNNMLLTAFTSLEDFRRRRRFSQIPGVPHVGAKPKASLKACCAPPKRRHRKHRCRIRERASQDLIRRD